jgi:hypothetical protein
MLGRIPGEERKLCGPYLNKNQRHPPRGGGLTAFTLILSSLHIILPTHDSAFTSPFLILDVSPGPDAKACRLIG